MLIFGPLGFVAPWVLTALLVLPVLWLILRATPPAPRNIAFPGVELLKGLLDKRPVAQRTPWWLLLLRLLAVAALILAFSGPVWKPAPQSQADGPLLVVMDAGWAAAPDWPARQSRAERALSEAASNGRPAALLLADGQDSQGPISFAPADTLLARLRAANPVSWETMMPDDPEATLADVPEGELSTLWLSDGLEHPGRTDWLSALQARGPVTVVPSGYPLRSLYLNDGENPTLTMTSLTEGQSGGFWLWGPDPQGIERELARLTPGEPKTEAGVTSRPVVIDLPPELRNRITSFQIEGDAHAGAVVLADDRVKRRKLGLIGESDAYAEGQQLLSPLYYLRRALAPTTNLVEGGLSDVLDAAPDVIIIADQVNLPDTERLTEWVDKGGLLIRFAGPAMAAYDRLIEEPLLPVLLRQGGRDIGGALSWGDPRGLLPFDSDGPFAGLTPPEDVKVRAQLMAQPSPELGERTIAALTDNTPVVTRSRQGDGQVVLFHVTANAEWSNLSLSGLFVQMLERLVSTARVSPTEDQSDDGEHLFWNPEAVLDGFGRLDPVNSMEPVKADDLSKGPGPGRPAGIYASGERRMALNAGGEITRAEWPGVSIENPAAEQERDLSAWLIALGALILLLDVLGTAALARGGRSAAILLVGIAMLSGQPLEAQEGEVDPDAARAAGEMVLAYVETGDEELDQTSYEGMQGLSYALRDRTTVEPGEPIGIDLESDELSVLTFLYWPVTEDQSLPSPQAYLKLNNYLRTGGLILFDTRDGDIAGLGGPDASPALQALAAPLEIPPLAPVPQDHVLTRSFFLLQDFPGRWQGRPVWAEAPPAGAEAEAGQPFRHLNDGVSPVVIGGNSWAEAWAIDENGYYSFPVGSGWEGEHQREMSLRFGINLVMYVLTGNYKSDQVHVPDLLERLRTEQEGGQ